MAQMRRISIHAPYPAGVCRERTPVRNMRRK
jgi:hypothetical protein